MKNKRLPLSITAAVLASFLLSTNVLAASTAVPKTQKIQETERPAPSSSVAVEKSEASTEALPKKGDSIAIGLPENLTPIASSEEAEALALKYANLSAKDVAHLETEIERDDGRIEYEVEFIFNNREYKYEFDGDSGEVIKFEYEIVDEHLLSPLTDGPITEQAAIEIVLSQAEGAEEDDLYLETDHDDGFLLYEGKLIYNNVEYEFEIDAESGEIIEWSAESIFS